MGMRESRKWQGKGTIEMAEKQTFGFIPVSMMEIEDFLFMQRGYAYQRLLPPE